MTSIIKKIKNRPVLWTILILLVIGGVAITNTSSDAKTAAPPAMPTPVVGVQTIAQQDAQVWSEFSGRLHAVDYAEIRPEVSGRITEIRFQDGQIVKAGDIIIVIDPRPYEAALAKAEANLASATTTAQFAKSEYERASNLVKSQTIAKSLYDERANNNRVAVAAMRAAEAELKQASLDLDRAYVKAPITGRISRAEVTVGNLVQSGANPPILTSIVSNDGIYADFEVDEQTYMQNIRANANTQDKEQQIPVELIAKGNPQPYEGTLHSFDNHIDTASGTIRARAKFDNKDNSLMPGMFVSVKLGSSNAGAMLVSERAIGSDQSKKFVFVVSPENKVVYREVTLGQKVQGQRIVLSGLKAGERVIVDGVQHVRPDMTVEVKEAEVAQNNAPSTVTVTNQ